MMSAGCFLEQRLSARTLVIDALRQWSEGLSVKMLADVTGLPRASLRRVVSQLVRSGDVVSAREPGFLTVYTLRPRIITRSEYMDNPSALHRRYFAQFVTPEVCTRVLLVMGKERLLASRDEHFNDIPLVRNEWNKNLKTPHWDDIGLPQNAIARLREAGECFSLSVQTCINKEAARQIVEGRHGL